MVQANDVAVGDRRVAALVDDLTVTQIVMYAGASGDYNPLHHDDRYTREVAGYPGIFAHGMLTMGMCGRVLTDWFGVDHLLRYEARFSRQVWPGDTLTATAEVTALRDDGGTPVADVSVVTTNGAGDVVLTGTATARLD